MKEADAFNDDGSASSPPIRTPMYGATHASRYQRQDLIRQIQTCTSRRLICYVAGISAKVDRDDTVGFVDLIHNVSPGTNLDLLLQTPGGDVDAAEKLISMVRKCVGAAELRVVVPDYAKSAGTLMALGADRIVMSESSELGPIDPQIPLSDGRGNRIMHSVQSYLDAFEDHAKKLRENPDDPVARLMLERLEPATLKLFASARDRARAFAEAQLRTGMYKSAGNVTKTVGDLIDTTKWRSHGQMIGWEDARDLGLTVEYLDQRSNEWQQYWQLYCLQRLAISDRQKLFESDYASLVFDGTE